MGRLRAAFSIVVLSAMAFESGCGGGSGALGSNPVPGSNGTQSVSVKIVVPTTSTASGTRRPTFVSPSLQSVVVQILNGTTPVVSGTNYVNVKVSSGQCVSSAGAITCTLSFATTITTTGTYTVIVGTYDAAQTANCFPPGTPACVGNALSLTEMPELITVGSSTPIALTLGGIPAFILPIELLSGYVGGENNSNILDIWGPGAKQAEFALQDADHNTIVGAGAPVLTATSANTGVLTASVTATPNNAGVYTLTLTPVTSASSAGPVVTLGTVGVNFGITIPNSGISTTVTNTLSINIKHSVMYVAHGSGILTIDGYVDGNSTPSQNVYSAGESSLGLAVDNNQNLWVADSGNNDIVTFPPADPTVGSLGQSWTFCGSGYVGCTGPGHSMSTTFANPGFLAFDSANNLYVSNHCCPAGSTYGVMQYNAPTATSSPNPASVANFIYSDATASYLCHVTVDNNGNVYVGTTNFSGPLWSVVSFMPGNVNPTTVGSFNINGLSVEPQNNYFWWINSGSTNAYMVNPSNGSTVHTISGLPTTTTDMAVDQLGNVFVAGGSGTTGVLEYTAASNWASSSAIGNSVDPADVAVYPDAVYGENHKVGVAQGGQIPIPIPGAP